MDFYINPSLQHDPKSIIPILPTISCYLSGGYLGLSFYRMIRYNLFMRNLTPFDKQILRLDNKVIRTHIYRLKYPRIVIAGIIFLTTVPMNC
jgi:hypothetical protein